MNNGEKWLIYSKNLICCKKYPSEIDSIECYCELRNISKASVVEIPHVGMELLYIWDGKDWKYYFGNIKNGKNITLLHGVICFTIRFKKGCLPDFLVRKLKLYKHDYISLLCPEDIPEEMMYGQGNMNFHEWVNYNEEFWRKQRIISMSPITKSIVEVIENNKGCISVKEIIERTGFSHRYIENMFRDDTGMSIKKYASTVRMQKCIEYIMVEERELIYEKLKFYDQSHFIHEFKNFTTYTPNQLHTLLDHNLLSIV